MKTRNAKREARNGMAAVVAVVMVLSWAMWLVQGMPVGMPQGGAQQMRFMPFDVFVDSGVNELGAYQIEVSTKDAMIVGLEGGEPAAFRSAPYYDPEALQPGGGGRIVVAAFSTAENLPVGLTRVARLHLQVNAAPGADVVPGITTRLIVATDGQGRTIPATVAIRPFAGDRP